MPYCPRCGYSHPNCKCYAQGGIVEGKYCMNCGGMAHGGSCDDADMKENSMTDSIMRKRKKMADGGEVKEMEPHADEDDMEVTGDFTDHPSDDPIGDDEDEESLVGQIMKKRKAKK